MLIFDKPYVSNFLLRTAKDLSLPVLNNGFIDDNISSDNLKLFSEEEFLCRARTQTSLKLYCNSENTINWITKN
jgi:hypothetical protein